MESLIEGPNLQGIFIFRVIELTVNKDAIKMLLVIFFFVYFLQVISTILQNCINFISQFSQTIKKKAIGNTI